ncbi:hypothetical protein TNCV_2122761 [Trichonephila clavipes]|nr:hypothetical protein TNCV_2122761 [Trichonephila clavipes]
MMGVSGISGRRPLKPTSVSRLLMVSLMALDVWKEVSGVESMLAKILLIARSSRSFCSWDVLTLRDGTLYLFHFANTEQLPYRSDRGGGRYVYSTNLLL